MGVKTFCCESMVTRIQTCFQTSIELISWLSTDMVTAIAMHLVARIKNISILHSPYSE